MRRQLNQPFLNSQRGLQRKRRGQRVFLSLFGILLIALALILKPDLRAELAHVGQFFTAEAPIISDEAAQQLALVAADQDIAEPEPRIVTREVTLQRGDTLLELLKRNGLGMASAHKMIETLRQQLDPRALRAGQNLQLKVDSQEETVTGLEYLWRDATVKVESTEDGWSVEKNTIPSTQRSRVVTGRVDSSLYQDGVEAGLSGAQIMELATIFEYDIDFFSDFKKGDGFSVLFEEKHYVDGRKQPGRVVAAEVEAGGDPFRIFHFTNRAGQSGYYDVEGKALRRAFLRAPLSYQRISSRYDLNRRHPIFRTVRPHRAIDYAAPAGTPVVALGRGQVTFAGWQGGYGNMVEIKHPSGYSTRYAHFSRIAKGIRRGKSVDQGDVVGYVGQTGHATGPHLHFEMLQKGNKINFLALRTPPEIQLTGADLKNFLAMKDERLTLLQRKPVVVAKVPDAE